MTDFINATTSKFFDDPISMTDDIRLDIVKNFTDPMSMPDAINATRNLVKVDPMSVIDDIKLDIVFNVDNPISMTDFINSTTTKFFDDPISMTDEIDPMIMLNFTDPISMTDFINATTTQIFDDPMSMLDDIRLDIVFNVDNPISMTDFINATRMILPDDPISMTDFINATTTQVIDDPMSMLDDIQLDIVLNFTDPLSMPDDAQPTLGIDDPMSLLDVVSTNFVQAPIVVIVEPPDVTVTGGAGGIGGSLPPTVPDSDGDGILDPEDACPLEPEDFDGFEDADGCPEDAFIKPPEELVVPSIVDLIPFEFNELDVIDDFIDLEEDLPQPQVEDLGVRWLGAEQITITSIDIGLSPFEIQVQDIPVTFGNNRFGYTETQLLYTVQPPDKICGNVFTFDCLDKVTYKIPVVVTGEINGKTVIADGSITIDNSDRINPYWLALFALILVPLISVMFWKKRSKKVTTKTKLKLTQKPNTTRPNTKTLTVTKSKRLKSGTTRKLLTESKKTNILGKKTK